MSGRTAELHPLILDLDWLDMEGLRDGDVIKTWAGTIVARRGIERASAEVFLNDFDEPEPEVQMIIPADVSLKTQYEGEPRVICSIAKEDIKALPGHDSAIVTVWLDATGGTDAVILRAVA